MSTKTFIAAALAVHALMATSAEARAQGAAPTTTQKAQAEKEKGKNADEVIKAYSVPESPAFSFLDVSPAKVTRPTTPRDLISSIVDAIDAEGRVRQGFALEVQPSAILRTGAGLRAYQESPLTRALTNAQVSLATVRAAGDSSSTDLSYGLRLTLFDRADPMASQSFTDSLANLLAECSEPIPPPPPNVDPAVAAQLKSAAEAAALVKEGACNRTGIERVRTKYVKDHWNDVHLALSYAGGHRLAGSLPREGKALGHRVWLVAGVPVLTYGQILGYYRLSNVLAAGTDTRTRLNAYGARAVVGKPTFNGFVELVGERRRAASGTDNNSARSWSGGLEFRVSDQLWLSTGLGSADEDIDGPTVVIANLRWGFSDKARFSPR
jgi:hypothetical protein